MESDNSGGGSPTREKSGKHLSLRIGKRTASQLDDLEELFGENRSEVLRVAIDRVWSSYFENRNSNLFQPVFGTADSKIEL